MNFVLHKFLQSECEGYKNAEHLIIKIGKQKKIKLVLKSLTFTRIPTIIESQTQLQKLVLCDLGKKNHQNSQTHFRCSYYSFGN